MADNAFGGILIRHLYKIFGPDAAKHIEAVKNGLTKAELNEKFGHVLGLRDIVMKAYLHTEIQCKRGRGWFVGKRNFSIRPMT